MTVWALLEDCVGQLDEPFRRSEIIGWFRRHHPEVNPDTLGAHIQAATANAANRAQNNPLGRRAPLVKRVDRGLYVRASRDQERIADREVVVEELEAANADQVAADLVLIGCVRTKRSTACAAADLFNSSLFDGRRLYAVASGRSWYILSAKYGLLAPEDIIGPYDVYLPDQSPGYRKAWGEFVIAQLEERQGDLRTRVVEVHAGAAYVDPLRAPLAACRARLTTPLAHLRQGEQLAWYGAHRRVVRRASPAAAVSLGGAGVDAVDLVQLLSDPSQALSPQELMRRGPTDLKVPGLYSWWVDERGAADLSAGLGLPISAGLIYAGQAGATRWPSGKRSQNTLWGRITGMHLGGAAEFSTFRRTLAAVLRPVLDLDREDAPGLSAWIDAHLRVTMVPVLDADSLGRLEAAVLDSIDPPMNLSGRPVTPIRARLTHLRRARGVEPATE